MSRRSAISLRLINHRGNVPKKIAALKNFALPGRVSSDRASAQSLSATTQRSRISHGKRARLHPNSVRIWLGDSPRPKRQHLDDDLRNWIGGWPLMRGRSNSTIRKCTRILILERLIHQILSRGRYDVFIARCLWGSA